MRRTLLVIAISLVAGCGEKVNSIQGALLLEGVPLEKVAVQFWSDTEAAEPSGVAVTIAEGVFAYRPTKHNESPWKPGRYLVRIVDPKSTILLKDPPDAREKPRVPWKYFNLDETPLRVDLDNGANDVGQICLEVDIPQ